MRSILLDATISHAWGPWACFLSQKKASPSNRDNINTGPASNMNNFGANLTILFRMRIPETDEVFPSDMLAG
jgi:hypothetical protein